MKWKASLFRVFIYIILFGPLLTYEIPAVIPLSTQTHSEKSLTQDHISNMRDSAGLRNIPAFGTISIMQNM